MTIVIEEIVSEFPILITEEVVQIEIADTASFLDLTDVSDKSYVGKNGFVPTVNEATGKMELKEPSGSGFSGSYDDLTDVPTDLVHDTDYVHTDNNFTDEEKLKLENVNKVTVKLSEPINKGQAVYISSANGTNIIVSKASNNSEATSSKTLGLLETTGATNAILNVVTDGLLSGLNTNSAAVGDAVWLGANGNLIYGLSNKPVAPAHLVYIGVVSRVHSINGEILIKVQNGFEMNEIHDFSEASYNSVIDADSLMIKDSINSLWKRFTFTNLKTYLSNIYALKSMSAYSMRANNTNATANSTEFDFQLENKKTLRDSGFSYVGTTAPYGAFTGSYSWILIGNFISLQMNGTWSNIGMGISSLTIPLPSDLPLPIKPDGFTSALNRQYQGVGYLAISNTGVANNNPAFIRANSANTGFEIVITSSAIGLKSFTCAFNYPKA